MLFVWDRTLSATARIRVDGDVNAVTEYQPDGRPVEDREPAGEVLSRVPRVRGEPRIFRLR